MQTALTLRKSSINAIAASFAVLVALTAGGAGGYLLRSQAPAYVATAAPPVTAQTRLVTPALNVGDSVVMARADTGPVTDAVDRIMARADTGPVTDAVDRIVARAAKAPWSDR